MTKILFLSLIFWVNAAFAASDSDLENVEIVPTLKVLTDGSGHFLVYDTKHKVTGPLFYGDATAVYAQRVYGGSSFDEGKFDFYFWEPRHNNHASFDLKDNVYSTHCGTTSRTFTPLSDDESAVFLQKVKFKKTKWKYRAHSLARNDKGIYYYVDAMREEFGKERRIFSGPRGAMKQLKMTNIVADSAGEIYATAGGEYRLVSNRQSAKWVSKKKPIELTVVPVEDNAQMIYSELGVYEKEKLGTPCDD